MPAGTAPSSAIARLRLRARLLEAVTRAPRTVIVEAMTERVQLRRLAHARSGDKGDTANVGVIAYSDEAYAFLKEVLSADRVADHFEGMIEGPVERHALDNLGALNFLLHGALGGGGTVSLMTDAQGKVYSTALLRLELDVPDEVLASLERTRPDPVPQADGDTRDRGETGSPK